MKKRARVELLDDTDGVTLHVQHVRYHSVGDPWSQPPGGGQPPPPDLEQQRPRQQGQLSAPAVVLAAQRLHQAPEWVSRPTARDIPAAFMTDLEQRRAALKSRSESSVVPFRKIIAAGHVLRGEERAPPAPRSTSPKTAANGKAVTQRDAHFGASLTFLREVDELLRGLLRQLTQRPEEREARLAAISHIEVLARSVGLRVGVYGSSRTGVVLPNSDLDLCVARVLPEDDAQGEPGPSTRCYAPAPRRNGFANPDFVAMLRVVRRSRHLCDVQPIAHARVPIIKCHFASSAIDIDISFTADGIHTSQYLEKEFAKPEHILARPLVILVKLLLRSWHLHDPKDGGVGSFVVSLLVLWYLTVVDRGHWTLPDDHPHSPTVSGRRSTDHQSGAVSAAANRTRDMNENLANETGRIASLLIGFLTYYGTQFPYRTTGIDITQRASFEKNDESLLVVNPLLPSQNAASAATLFGGSVRRRFAEVARILSGSVSRRGHVEQLSALEAVSSVFAKEVVDDKVWKRWSTADYDTFKQSTRGTGEQQHQGVLFRKVVVPSPISAPSTAPCPVPPLSDNGTVHRGARVGPKTAADGESHDDAPPTIF